MEQVQIDSDKKLFKVSIDTAIDRLNARRIDPHHAILKEIADDLGVDYNLNDMHLTFSSKSFKETDKRIEQSIEETDELILKALFKFNSHSRKAARKACISNQDYLKKHGLWERLVNKFKNHFDNE